MSSQLTTPEMCRRTGATYRELDYWTRCGYVTPILSPAAQGFGVDGDRERTGRDRATPGSGVLRQWSPGQAVLVARMVRLVRAGLKPAVAAAVARGEDVIGPGIRVVIA